MPHNVFHASKTTSYRHVDHLVRDPAGSLFSLFLVGPDYPQNQIAVLMVAVVAIIQFAPSYATPGYKD